MTPHASADAAAYRQMLQAAFLQADRRIARTARQLEVPDVDGWREAADALPRYVEELRLLVHTWALAPEPAERAIAAELRDTYAVALRAIGERLGANQPTSACQLAQRLLDLLRLELTWMSGRA